MPSHRKLSPFAKLVRSFKGTSGNPVKKAAKVWRSKKSLCKSPKRTWVKGKRSVRRGHCRKASRK